MSGQAASILERVGVALNSNNLAPDGERACHVDLVGALGMVQINASGDAHEQRELPTVDPHTELGAVLVRLKYAGDLGLSERAVRLLVLWISHQRAYARWKMKPASGHLLERFARQALDEWLDETCRACLGRKMLGMERDAIRERRMQCPGCRGQGRLLPDPPRRMVAVPHAACLGRGWLTKTRLVQQNPRQCSLCSGTGRRIASDAERARAMGLQLVVYQKHWPRRFSWMESAFDRINTLEKNCLRASLTQG